MTREVFLNAIEFYGEENILGFGFDNSASLTFQENEFSLANNFIDELSCLQFITYDIKNNPFYTIKSVEDIQAIMVRANGVDFNAYDRINIRS